MQRAIDARLEGPSREDDHSRDILDGEGFVSYSPGIVWAYIIC